MCVPLIIYYVEYRLYLFQVVVLKDELVVRCDNANDAGRCKRQVQRAYRLPRDIDVKTLKSTVKSNGTLQITANKRRLY